MRHTLTTYLCLGYLDTTLFTNDAAMLQALVLTAETFVVLYRTEDLCTEQSVSLRLERPVVNRLGFLDLAERP